MFTIFRIMLLLLLSGLLLSIIVAIAYSLWRRIEQGKLKRKAGELPSDAGIRDLLLEERVAEAVETYRKFTGVDEFTAKKVIEDMQREMRLDDTVRASVQDLLDVGDKAGAIETYQAATGASLAEALAYVEGQVGRKK
jgi:hypothetical protein